MVFQNTGAFMVPGIEVIRQNTEKEIWWGHWTQQTIQPAIISGAARDLGQAAGETDILRPGLLMGQITTTKKLLAWDPTNTDGSEQIHGVLLYDQKMQLLNSDKDRWVGIMTAGKLKENSALIDVASSTHGLSGKTNEYIARAQLHPRFLVDDKLEGSYYGGWRNIVAKGVGVTAYTVLEAENNTLFTNKGNDGNINFTLPATAKLGLRYGFLVVANFNLVLTAGTVDTMVVFNDAAADSVAYQTTDDKIGGFFEVIGDGALWYVFLRAWGADGVLVQTVTIGT